ncbi:MAG: dihydroneopterin aldolase [Acetobacteraceae bacterium]
MSLVHILADQMTVPADGAEEERRYRMRIRNLVLPARIGVYAEEKLGPQRVRFSLDLAVLRDPGPLGDDIAHVLSYDDLIAGIRALLARGHINLVETLAEAICDFCLADPHVQEAQVAVEKLDIVPEAESVGVEITRRRAGLPATARFPMPASRHGGTG